MSYQPSSPLIGTSCTSFIRFSSIVFLYALKTPDNGLKAADYIQIHLISQGLNALGSIFILESQLRQH